MPTFIIKNKPDFAEPIQLEKEDEHHLIRVSRAKKGEIFFVTDNKGHIAEVSIENIRPFQCKVLHVKTADPPAPITVCLSLITMNRLEWAIQKLCELNIHAVQLITSERSQSQLLSPSKMDRLQKIALEAQKQCGRATPLLIESTIPLMEIQFNTDLFYVAGMTNENQTPFPWKNSAKKTHIFIGPEGGFSKKECDFLQNHNVRSVNLGQTILRSETAAIVMASLAKYS